MPVKRIVVSGGGSQSRQAMQMTADIFNMETFRPHTYETSSLGAAINAAVGMKYFDGYDAAVGSMTRTGEQFSPEPREC
ncbi:MAG: FGGY-family carbohydrate kinase [Marinilabiliales bacterium]|nr:FGGY-family carbohydrate kinase [Marinilabiliales bacterium]